MSESRDTCRRSFKTFLAKLGKNNKRQLGFKNNKRGLQIGIFGENPTNRNKENKCSCERFTYSVNRNRSTFWKKRYRRCTCKRKKLRFLQYVFSSTKKDRRFETCHKFKTSEQVSSEKTLQNGFSKQCLKLSTKRRLGNFSRSERCLFPHTNSRNTQKVSKILCQQSVLPISGAVLRSNIDQHHEFSQKCVL